MRFTPMVFMSERVREATAVGLVRPMALVPAAWLARMTPEVLEAVVAHELAHIRRWDLWASAGLLGTVFRHASPGRHLHKR